MDAEITKFPENDVSRQVVDCAFYVHQKLGPGLLESAYQKCLCLKLMERNVNFKCEVPMDFYFDSHLIQAGYKIDILIPDQLIVELKSVTEINPLYEAQILTYMKLSGIKTGLLINFNSKMFKNGIKRFVL